MADLILEIRQELQKLVDAGQIRIELCGHMLCAPHVKGFTLDKRRYTIRFEDETEDSVRVMIDRKPEAKGANGD
jgi:hypothetical protein